MESPVSDPGDFDWVAAKPPASWLPPDVSSWVTVAPRLTSLDALGALLGGRTLSVKRVSLLLLVVQNSALILLMHNSRATAPSAGPPYLTSTAVLLVEALKLVMSFGLAVYEILYARQRSSAVEIQTSIGASLSRALLTAESFQLIIPAALYTLQNTLVYIATGNLEPVTFQVMYQLKILTTVLFSVIILGKLVGRGQWLSLGLLAIGVAAVQMDKTKPGDGPALKKRTVATSMDATAGLLAVTAASLLSGLTCVYFEKLLKAPPASPSEDPPSLWIRNTQLSFWSLFPAGLIGVVWRDGAAVMQRGFFAGYTPQVWAVVTLQAAGGLLVAVCIAKADNVAKNFATSLSIVLSGGIDVLLGGGQGMGGRALAGTIMVLLAMYLYQIVGKTPSVQRAVLPFSKQQSTGG